MATVSLKFSQNVIDQQRILEQTNSPYGSFNGIVGSADPGAGSELDLGLLNWNLDGSTLRVNYTQNVTETYTGIVRDNPLASSGHATATAYQMQQAGVFSVKTSGRLNFDYSLGNNSTASLQTSAQGHILDSIRIASEYAATNPHYDPVFGNVAVSMGGHMVLGADGALSGVASTIMVQADKLLNGAIAEGRFFIDPNTPGGVSGILTGYNESYYDGSTLVLGGFAMDVAALGATSSIYTDPRLFGGADVINVEMPGRLYEQASIQSGAGADSVTLKGGGGLLGVNAGDGDDVITLADNGHAVDGGAGFDVVKVAAPLSAYAVLASTSGSGFTLTDRNGVVSQLTNVERVSFTDTAYALDIDGHGGQAYRLYQAAFAREPDKGGLGFWIAKIDQGVSLVASAQGFINSEEYQSKYGLASSNRELVYQYYANILHRAPEDAGLNFWVDVLDQHKGSVAEVLSAISESPENQHNVGMLIANGFAYTPY